MLIPCAYRIIDPELYPDDFETIMNVAREYNASYFIIYHDVLRNRYGLAAKWFVRNEEIHSQDLPGYMEFVYTDPTNSYLVYKLNWNKNHYE